MDNNIYNSLVNAFKALGDQNRMKIVQMLSYGELCACKILDKFNLTQPTLSHHMKILCDSGMVNGRREGKWMYYSINKERISEMEEVLKDIKSEKLHETGCKDYGCNCSCNDDKIQLYVLTGFLGSGKTTILLRLLDALQKQRVGVIQNEFGKLGIDGTILRKDNIEMVEINKGSIFCSCLKLSFVEALSEMSKQNLKYLFVESSGLGDPSNVEEILEAVKVMAGDKYDFRGAICLVDAVNFLDQLDDLETVYRQLKHCHLSIITKVDLVEPEKFDEIKEKIREINPVCPIKLSSKANLDLQFLQDDLMKYKWAECEETTNSAETKPKSIFLNFKGQLEKEKLELFLDVVKKEAYRIKGFFDLKDIGWQEIQVVGDLVDFRPCDPKEMSQLVFISKIGPAIIRTIANTWNENIDEKMELKN